MIKPKTWVETLIITYFLSQSNLGGRGGGLILREGGEARSSLLSAALFVLYEMIS